MVKVTKTKDKKSNKDKRIDINGIPIGYEELSRHVQRLRDIHGEKKVRKHLEIPSFKHRKHKIPDLTLKQTKKIVKELYENEDRLYPPSKGKQGRKMLQQKLSRDLFRSKRKHSKK